MQECKQLEEMPLVQNGSVIEMFKYLESCNLFHPLTKKKWTYPF